MRLRCPDSSPGKGQTGVASAQERKTNALTPLHSCNSSRGNVWGGGHPTGCTTTHVTCRGLESPTCPQVTVTHAWAHHVRGSLSQPEHSRTMTQACFWSLVTWLKPSEQSTNAQEKAQEAGIPASTQGRNRPSVEDAPACLGLTQGTHVCHQQVQPEHPLKSCQCPSELGGVANT